MKLKKSLLTNQWLTIAVLAIICFRSVDGAFAIPSSLTTRTCNIQTTLDFQFSSSSTIGNNKFLFLDRFGNDLSLSLASYSYSTTTTLVTGYTTTFNGGMLLQYPSAMTNGNVYVYVPFTTSDCGSKADCVDLANSRVPSNTLQSYAGQTILSPFNFFQNTDYNQWYTAVDSANSNTVLVSKFVYKIASAPSGSVDAIEATFGGLSWNYGTGDKLCYASLTAGNFQTHLRQNVPLWFIWWLNILYWLAYLLSDATNKSIFNKDLYRDNKWTCWSLYSITHLAHQQFFTRLSRLTVVLLQISIQGVFVASIIAGQYVTGPSVIVWSAAISWAVTIIFPFLWGNIFHRKIYQKNLLKYEHKRTILSAIDKSNVKNIQAEIDVIQEKLYGYYHWFNCIAFVIFFVCWPITISRIQSLPRTAHVYNWYWLAAMAVIFVFQYFIYEPFLIACFGEKDAVKNRGGYYYDFRIGQAYQAVNDS